MRRKRLLWQIFPSYLLLVAFALAGTIGYGVYLLKHLYRQHTSNDLLVEARLVAPQILPVLTDQPAVDRICKTLGNSPAAPRITVVLPDGRVLGDSHESPALMENHADREEIRQALAGNTGVATRYSHTLRKVMMYVGTPIYSGNHLVAVVRTSLPMLSIGQSIEQFEWHLLLGGLCIGVLAAIISLVVSRRITSPLEELRQGALRYANGDLKQKLPVPASVEIGSLAEALNTMGSQLDERISTILRQRNEQEAILFSMVEGVLAVDTDERIISLNRAAAQMLNTNQETAIGRLMQEVIRHTDIQQFIQKTLSGAQPVEGDIMLRDGSERYVQATGSLLHDARSEKIGAVIVLNDITRLRRLENVRRDFVANVSHELRTPITSIKGFVEMLIDGAMRNPDEAEHFLHVVDRQVDRLDSIIEDLLLLSMMEQGNDRSVAGLHDGKLLDVLQSATEICGANAREKSIDLLLDCPEDLQARINPPLLEQAVTNLVDNAIKYSAEGGSVRVIAACEEGEILVHVADTGCGISAEHLPRLFERFYRVDKARSRKLGGTGLGLAIVKHIAQAHEGYVSVASTPGKGSIFTIHLPVPSLTAMEEAAL